mgnify:FL=1
MFARDPQSFPLPAVLLAMVALGGCLSLSGCAETAGPPLPAPEQGGALVEGAIQPDTGTFVFKQIEQEVPGYEPLLVTLIGSDLRVDPAARTVAIDVALRNAGEQPLYAPATIWLSRFAPSTVTVLNADFHLESPDTAMTVAPLPWGFDYSRLLGGDALLAPGETSESKPWLFHVPELSPFSFAARLECGLIPELPQIAGRVFLDLNADGVMQDDEPPYMVGPIHATGPGGFDLTALPDRSGFYALPVRLPGLYTLTMLVIQPDPERLLIVTTPNPLEVLLPPGPDGRPLSFTRAHFGVFCADAGLYPPVQLSPVPLDSLGGDYYAFLGGALQENVLMLDVGFSGCQPEHPFRLLWAPGAQVSPLPHADLVLVHDDLGEMCDAWWVRRPGFDLSPLRRALGTTLPIYLHLRDFAGEIHDFVWELPDDDEGDDD